MANLFDMKGGKMFAVLSKIAERLPPEVGDAILRDEEGVLGMLVSGALNAMHTPRVHGFFTPIEEQIALVREWNRVFNWGFSDTDFVNAGKLAPEWPEDKLCAVTLVPYLHGKDSAKDVGWTFHALWKLAASRQEACCEITDMGHRGTCEVYLIDGLENLAKENPILRWEVTDLGCNRNQNPVDLSCPEHSPHAGILAAAALHPEWIRAMDGGDVPHVWVPGYLADMDDINDASYANIPRLHMAFKREIALFFARGEIDSEYSVPSFVSPPILVPST